MNSTISMAICASVMTPLRTISRASQEPSHSNGVRRTSGHRHRYWYVKTYPNKDRFHYHNYFLACLVVTARLTFLLVYPITVHNRIDKFADLLLVPVCPTLLIPIPMSANHIG